MELKPVALPAPNYDTLERLCQSYINDLSENGRVDEDLEHYIFEAAMEAIYGKDVWAWINVRFR